MKEREKHILENGLWKYNLVTGKYYFSPGIFRIFNLEFQDLQSHDTFLKWIYPSDIDNYIHSFDEKIKLSPSFTLSYRIILNDGTIKNIEENVNTFSDENGKTLSYYGIISDITSAINLQRENKKAFSLIDSILKTLPNLIFVKDIDAGFRFSIVNDKFASFYGFTSEEIVGKYDKDISTPEQAKECYITDSIASKHTISSPLISIEEIPISKKSVKYMQTIKFAHVINDTNYLVCSAMDITDLVKAKQKAEESDKLKSAFLRTISHEIRTPMNSIMGYSQLIGESKDKNELSLFCEKIKENSGQLLNLITDIVYLAKLETVKKEIVYENVDMEFIFSVVKNHYEKQVKSKNLNFVYIPHHESKLVSLNKDCVIELMKHFMDNAVKFTDNGTITMGYDIEDRIVKIWVKDTGIGIDKKNRKIVFKRFVKISDFTPGTGIGLYIAQKIAKALKGKIGLNSEIGKGTYVWAELPI